MIYSENEKTQDCNTSVKREIHAETELRNDGMFETKLIEGHTEALVKASTSNACHTRLFIIQR